MPSPRLALLLAALLWVPIMASGQAGIVTRVTVEDLDPAAYSECMGGATRAVADRNGPAHVAWTTTTQPQWDGIRYGEGRSVGPRHVRIGFRKSIAIGTVFVRGGGRLGYLKPGAAYPGNLADDRQWVPAQRLVGRALVTTEVGDDEYAAWLLPPGTSTRALRFSHSPAGSDQRYSGWLGGLAISAARWANVAGQSRVVTRSNPDQAQRIVNGTQDNTWGAWENGPGGGARAVSPTDPCVVSLAWPQPVRLGGLCALWAGFGACEVDAWTGGPGTDPVARTVDESNWRKVGAYTGLDNRYACTLGLNWLLFDEVVATRAIRLRITAVTGETHPHLSGNTRGGKRVWLGELAAILPLGNRPLQAALLPAPRPPVLPHAPIAIRFTLPRAAYVTLVVEDARTGRRVRNLVSETRYPAGRNVAYWDGLDDLGRDREAVRHGIYTIPARMVGPGAYRVRGLWRDALHLRYRFSVYNAGSPAWETADGTGGWLTNHTPPQAVCYLPGDRAPGGKPLVYLGSFVSEGGSGLAWVDMQGRKVGGRGWVGGNWTAAPYLARDDGPARIAGDTLYVAAPWFTGDDSNRKDARAEIRITAITAQGDRAVARYEFDPAIPPGVGGDDRWARQMGGFAVRDGLVAVSLRARNELLMLRAQSGKVVGRTPVADPRGVAFDRSGRLLVLSGTQLVAIEPREGARPTTTVGAGLLDPIGIAVDTRGQVYVTDRGASHQVKVFSAAGLPVRVIGNSGSPRAGPYDPGHMNNPAGLDVDGEGRTWVSEADYSPKRVSLWSPDGKLLKAFYGPGQYGGGGTLDPADPTRFTYSGVEFRLDWTKGVDRPVNVFHRPGPGDSPLPDGYGDGGAPETPIRAGGRLYMTNCYSSNPTNGASIASVWIMQGGIARFTAALGRAGDWSLLKGQPFVSRRPAGVPATDPLDQVLFAWSDLNGDHQVQPAEVQMARAATGGVTVMPGLGFVVSRVGDRAMLYPPLGFTPAGSPVYNLLRGRTLVIGAQGAVSSGGDQALAGEDGWTIFTNAPKPFEPEGLGGAYRGKPMWSYPSLWPGLHAGHEAPAPDRPGELIATTRLLGGFVRPRRGQAGPLWCVNGNMGPMYLLTSDGLFVGTLFQDVRQGKPWSMPIAPRGMLLDDVSPHDENFWPSVSQAPDGRVFIVDGGRTSLVEVEGLDSVRRIAPIPVQVTAADLARAREWQARVEAARQAALRPTEIRVAHVDVSPGFGGWEDADWAAIDRRGVAAYFNSNSKPYDVSAAAAVSGEALYLLYRTGDPGLLRNSGKVANALFKTGGALDLMVGTAGPIDRTVGTPLPGDVRVVVAMVDGSPRAMLYEQKSASPGEGIPFSSPWRTIRFDRVVDITDQVTLREDGAGSYLLSVPLAMLGLKPTPGRRIRADLGVLRGDGVQTLQRVYWSNKATGITSDVPSEAELTPRLWGLWEF